MYVTSCLLVLFVVRDFQIRQQTVNNENQREHIGRSVAPAESTDKYVQSWNEIVWSAEDSIALGLAFRSLHLFVYYLCSVFVSLIIN